MKNIVLLFIIALIFVGCTTEGNKYDKVIEKWPKPEIIEGKKS